MRFFSAALASIAAAALVGAMFTGAAQSMPKPDKPAVSALVELTAGKAKKSGGPGTCGAMKYWDKKTRQCADATQKK
jgi:hypothetical protein